MQYDFKKTWWLKWFWPHIEPIYLKEGHFGTRQSAKSHNIARKLIYHSFQNSKFNVIHSRKVYSDIEGSTFKILTDLIYKYFPNDFIIRKNHFEIINKHTGNWFRGLGMDKAEKGKGVEGANIAWLNEANQYTKEDYDYIMTTLRGNDGEKISIIMDWNPESINHWLKKEVDTYQNHPECLFCKSTFWDNYTIDREALHERLLQIKAGGKEGERRYKVWANGDWGIEDMDSSFAYAFDSDIHVINAKIVPHPAHDLILSFDFNVTNTCGVNQFRLLPRGLSHYAEITRIKTYRIGDLKSLCEEIKAEYPGFNLVVNGDASGGNRSAFSQENYSAYQTIQAVLGITVYQMKIPASNPSHVSSKVNINQVFQRCKVQISSVNDLLIADLKEAQVDRAGSLDPWKTKNPNKGHSLDEFRYFCWQNFHQLSRELEL